MARVDGKPRMVSERYVGSAAEVAALLDARERERGLPTATRHLGFGTSPRPGCWPSWVWRLDEAGRARPGCR